MNSVYRSTISHGERMLADRAELLALKVLAKQHRKLLQQLERAVLDGDTRRADYIAHKILGSFAAKVSAVARTRKHDPEDGPVALAELKQLASPLNPYLPIVEPVRAVFMEKGDHDWRIVTAFGPRRRASQVMCADILRIRLPAYDFDFMEKGNGGAEGAALRLKAMMEGAEFHNIRNTDQGAVCLGVPIAGGQHDHVVTADITDCFGS
jgi:hypothetical protein